MSTGPGRLGRWLANRRLDVDAALLGLVLAVLIFPLRFLAAQIYIETLPIVLGLASLLYLLAVRHSGTTQGLPRLPGWFARLSPSLVVLGMAGMLLVATLTGGRTLHFYDVGGAVGTLVLVQILLVDERDLHTGLVLLELLALSFVVRFAALYTNPGFVGIDVWTHVPVNAAAILRAHSLAPISDSKYYASPFYHLLTVVAAQFYGVSLRNALYLTVGVVMPLSTLLLYGTARYFLSARWALFATALYANADQVVRWGIHLIPTSLGLVFFLAILYSLTRILHTEQRTRDFGLLLFFSVAVVLTHQISSFITLVLLGAGLLGQLLLRFDLFNRTDPHSPFVMRLPEPINLVGIMVFDVGLMTFMWSLTPYKGKTFLQTMLNYFQSTLTSSAGFLNLASGSDGGSAAASGAGASPTLLTQLITYLDTGGFLLLLFAGVVGSLVVLERKRATQATFTYLGTVVVMLVFVLGLPLFGIRNFVPGRWFAFLYAPLAVLGALGLRYLTDNLSVRTVGVVLALFVLVFPSVMLVSGHATIDRPAFPSHQQRLSYSQPELTAVHTIGDIRGPNPSTPLYTDHPYETVFARTGASPAKPLELQNGRPVRASTVVYRTYEEHGATYFVQDGHAVVRQFAPGDVCQESMNTVYTDGAVRMCTSPTTGGSTAG